MFALFVLALAVVAVAATPAVPQLPSQYMVEDIHTHMDTNAGYPPHYTEEDTAHYFDFELKKVRYDVATTTYGTKGPFSKVYDYNTLFPNNCGKQYPDVEAARGYMVKGGQCCWASLVQNCPFNGQDIPTAQTMTAPVMPTKIEYLGKASGEGIVPESFKGDVEEWESAIYLKQEVPVLLTDYYFDAADHTTQLGSFMAVTAGPQFVNATTTFNGKWTIGPQAAELFDLDEYDCSSPCNTEVTQNLQTQAKLH